MTKYISSDGTVRENRTVARIVKDFFWSIYTFIAFFFYSLTSPNVTAEDLRSGGSGPKIGRIPPGEKKTYHQTICGSCG
ncbi:hypothetical protein Glove_437g28 [Diversispora epigaea]|uniref:Selenoprotein K n=1 Tax=Diversispora epigaea TaxID=1348612 RepID=A0A397GVV0_9GLOM|nr:hypothetical protein Glove_437g28 [Diversispora epigaea]